MAKNSPTIDSILSHYASTGLIFAENQVSIGAEEKLMDECFEQWLWALATAEICQLQSDNEIFNAELFVKERKKKFQTQSFSGVGAHHHNPIDKRLIQAILYMV